MNARYRAATARDLDAVEQLEGLCFGDAAWPRALLTDGIAGDLPTISYWVAEVEGGLVAYLVLSIAGDLAEIQRVGTHPEHRRHGVGTGLVEIAADAAREQRADRILLEVSADNPAARSMYVAAGFTQIDVRPRYYRDGSDALVLRRPLLRGCGGAA